MPLVDENYPPTRRLQQPGDSQTRSFWSAVMKTDGCWTSSRKNIKCGGTFQMGRFSYALHYGKDPGGLNVARSCGNSSCVNPKHLALSSKKNSHRDYYNVVDASVAPPRNVNKLYAKDKVSDSDRLLSKVDELVDCWIWRGGCRFRLGDSSCDPRRASWIIQNGPIESNICITNTCENSECVNPDHLKAVDKSQHVRSIKRSEPRKIEFYPLADNQQSVVRGIQTLLIPVLTGRQRIRFLSRLDKTDECWLWTCESKDKGYGYVTFNGKSYLSHRVSYAIHHHVNPGNFIVDHTCNNPPCCNPAHLELVTPKENAQRMVAQGRHQVGRGHTIVPTEHHHQIVDGITLRKKTMSQVAQQYGVGRVCISRIVARYADVDMRKKLSDDDIAAIVSSDLPYHNLARQFSVSAETIAHVRHKAGLSDKRLRLTDTEREFVLNSNEKGTILANKFGVDQSTIYRLRAQQRSVERED